MKIWEKKHQTPGFCQQSVLSALWKLNRMDYCMSEKSWPISYRKLLHKLGQDFLSTQYLNISMAWSWTWNLSIPDMLPSMNCMLSMTTWLMSCTYTAWDMASWNRGKNSSTPIPFIINATGGTWETKFYFHVRFITLCGARISRRKLKNKSWRKEIHQMKW